MDFKDSIKQLAERILQHKELVQTEEATKHSFVMPFIQALGYDVFNPFEVMPEFVADLGIKKGEKVDYAIMRDGKPIILIECKHWHSDLDPHNSQLFRYFHTTTAKFSILTNGFESRFYTDLEQPNKMDEKPFFIFDIRNIKENQIEELKKFHKSYFDDATILSTASSLKFTSELKAVLASELNNPSPEFVKLLSKQVFPGLVTPKRLEQFTALTKQSFQQFINDVITDRLKSALKTEETDQTKKEEEAPKDEGKIETTADELEAYQIVRSIVRKVAMVSRVCYRDAQSYFAILFDDNNRKPICRLHFTDTKKYMILFDDSKKEVRKDLASLDDIFSYDVELCKTVQSYLK